jgi:hypothetical protein
VEVEVLQSELARVYVAWLEVVGVLQLVELQPFDCAVAATPTSVPVWEWEWVWEWVRERELVRVLTLRVRVRVWVRV